MWRRFKSFQRGRKEFLPFWFFLSFRPKGEIHVSSRVEPHGQEPMAPVRYGVTRRSSSPPSPRLRRTTAFLHGRETVASCEGG